MCIINNFDKQHEENNIKRNQLTEKGHFLKEIKCIRLNHEHNLCRNGGEIKVLYPVEI